MKKVLAIMAVVAVVAVASVAQAATFTVSGEVTGATTLTVCDLTLAAVGLNAGDEDTCNVVYYTNKSSGSSLTYAAAGLTNTGDSYVWDDPGTDYYIDPTCTGTCDEEYGFRIDSVTEYATVGDDGTVAYNQADCQDGVAPGTGALACSLAFPTSADEVLANATPITDGSSFDIYVAYTSDGDTNSGTYSQTVTAVAT